MSVRFTEVPLEGTDGVALVIAPTTNIVLTRARLRAMEADRGGSDVDYAIIEAVHAASPNTIMTIFSGRGGDDGGSWSFEESLTEQECERFGTLLVLSQLATYRALLKAGIRMHVRVGMPGREHFALRVGKENALDQLPMDAADDRWILENFVYLFSMSLARLTGSFVADNESRFSRIVTGAERFAAKLHS